MKLRDSVTASALALVVLFSGGVALDAACSPSSPAQPADAGPVCDPDSGDPAGCPCDPATTKTADCYTGPLGTQNKGICKLGTRSCTPDGKYTACVGEQTPQPETCNYADDDCNGLVDDVPAVADAAVIARCNSPACDSANMSDAGITCWGPDPGICGAGIKTCTGSPTGGTPTGCDEFIHTPAAEVCNGIDDDCNGAVDDGLDQEGPCDMPNGSMWAPDANPLEAGPDGAVQKKVLGECLHGNLTCVDSNCGPHGCADAGDQCFPSQPTSEVLPFGDGCDGKDNDCNGVIDDHACSDSQDVADGYIYCCDFGGGFFGCEDTMSAGCKLAN